jgi:hypothetical protein
MTGGRLPTAVTLNGQSYSTLPELETAYGQRWHEGDEELLELAANTDESQWFSGEGGKFTPAQLARLEELHIGDSAMAGHYKNQFNRDTTALQDARIAVGQ